MNYLVDIKNQNRQATRPSNHEGLLFHPVADDPMAPGAVCYSNWEFDHGSQRRFFVGGMLWFLGTTGLNANSLAAYKDEAVKAVQARTNWASMKNSNRHWQEEIARQQFNSARNQSPLFFQKAATIIMACELATEVVLNQGKKMPDVTSPLDIYRYMSIIPACWNVDDFNESFYAQHIAKSTDMIDKLRKAAAQTQKAVFSDLADGHTVTYQTAKAIKDTIDLEGLGKFSVGPVRARPGKKSLGQRRTSDYENCDCG